MLSTSPEQRNWSAPPGFACGEAVCLGVAELPPLPPQAARTSATTNTLHRTARSLSNARDARLALAPLQCLEAVRLDGTEGAGAGDRMPCRPRQKRRREVISVGAGQVDLRELSAGFVVRLGGDPGRTAGCGARVGTGQQAGRLLAPEAHRGARQRDAVDVLPDIRARLQRPRQRPEPAEVDVDLAQSRV